MDETEATGAVKQSSYLQHPAVIISDGIGFFALATTGVYLAYALCKFRGPDGEDLFWMGRREEKFLSVFVNFFAAIAYWARICAHANGDSASSSEMLIYRHADYLVTCPLLTIDLIWTLGLPYKFSCGTAIFLCAVAAIAAEQLPAPARFMWFCFGLVLFISTLAFMWRLVRLRLEQFGSGGSRRNLRRAQLACGMYFVLWGGYPLLWLLKEFEGLDHVWNHVLMTVLDVCVKCIYGLALLSFKLEADQNYFTFVEVGDLKTSRSRRLPHAQRGPKDKVAFSKERREDSDLGNRRASSSGSMSDIEGGGIVLGRNGRSFGRSWTAASASPPSRGVMGTPNAPDEPIPPPHLVALARGSSDDGSLIDVQTTTIRHAAKFRDEQDGVGVLAREVVGAQLPGGVQPYSPGPGAAKERGSSKTQQKRDSEVIRAAEAMRLLAGADARWETRPHRSQGQQDGDAVTTELATNEQLLAQLRDVELTPTFLHLEGVRSVMQLHSPSGQAAHGVVSNPGLNPREERAGEPGTNNTVAATQV